MKNLTTDFSFSGTVFAKYRRFILALAALVLAPTAASAHTESDWTLRNPLPTNEYLYASAWSGTIFAAVGNGGTLLTSPNGITWTPRTSGVTSVLNAVVWTGTQFAAAGDAGVVLTSTDGITWTKRTTGTTKTLRAIVWTGSNLVAVGEDGTALTSSTGVTWTTRFTGTSLDLNAAVWTGSGLFVVGQLGITLESASGASWAQASQTPALNFTSVTWDGGQLIAATSGGTLHTSTNGTTWTLRYTSGTSLAAVYWNGSTAIAAGSDGSILTSTDGLTWTVRSSGVDDFLYGIAQGGSTTLVIGATGTILTSPDTFTWTSRSQVSNANLRDVAWTGQQVIAVGAGGTILSSPQGFVWSVETSGTTADLESLTWAGDKLVLVGAGGVILTSPDGNTWTPRTSGTAADLLGVTWTRSLVIAVGTGGTILTSPDGITWTARTSGTALHLRSVAWSGSNAVAVGDGGITCTSADALTWVATTVAPFADLAEVAYAGTQFCAVGDGDTILTSPTGATWTQRSVASGQNLLGVAWTGDDIIVVGTSQTILTSSDGEDWELTVPGSVKLPVLHSVEYLGTLLVTVGDAGDILTSGDALAPAPIVNFALAAQTVTESIGVFTLGVQLSFAPASTITIPFTLSGTTTSGADFTISASPVSFAAGQSLKNITLTVKDDVLVESAETLIVTIGAPAQALIGTISIHTLTLTDNDIAPLITTHPISQIVAIGAAVTTFTAAATGSAPLTLQWRKNGANIASATGASYSVLNAQLTHAGQYTIKATNPTGNATSTVAELAVVSTATKALQIPVGGTATFTISAAGNGLTYLWRKNGVAMTNGGRISGVTTTKLIITALVSGDSDIYTCAVTGPGGLLIGGAQTLTVLLPPVMNPVVFPSTMVSSSFSHTVTATQMPTKFSMTGLPKGIIWNATTGAVTGRATVSGTFLVQCSASNSAGISPVITATLVVQSLPAGALGVFTGSIAREATVNASLGGRVDLTTTSTGGVSGKVTLGGTSYSFTSLLDTAFAAAPQVNVNIPRGALPAIQLALILNAGTQTLSGTVGLGGPTAAVTGWRQVWNTLSQPATTSAGYYSIGLDIGIGDVGNDAIPQGTGYATCTVALDGKLTFAGKTADSTAFTSATHLGPLGQALIFQSLYTNTGSLHGQIALTLDGALAFTSNTFSGSLTWLRKLQGASVRSYQAGFGPLDLDVYGRYLAPDNKSLVLGLPASTTTAQLLFAEGGVELSVVNPDVTAFTFTDAFLPVLPSPGNVGNPGKATLTLNKSTGLITGKFTLLNGTITRLVSYEGVIIRPASGTRKAFGFYTLPQLLPTVSTSPILSGQMVIQQP